jgi:hypothetical protein
VKQVLQGDNSADKDLQRQIIVRARELHLLNNYRTANTSSPPSDQLKSDVQAAWIAYFRSKVCECLPDEDVPKEGEETNAVANLAARYNSEAEVDKEWAKKIRLTDEKFGLYLTSLVSGRSAIIPAAVADFLGPLF